MPEMKPEEPTLPSAYHSATPFSVPSGYFDALPGRVTQNLPRESSVVSQRERFPNWAVAASFATVSMCAVLFFFNPGNQVKTVSLDPPAEAQTYEDVLEEEGVLEYVNDDEFIGQFDAELAALYPQPSEDTISSEIEEIILTNDIDELELYLEL
jgi:hypothetical protein